jgi:hypothetical protein
LLGKVFPGTPEGGKEGASGREEGGEGGGGTWLFDDDCCCRSILGPPPCSLLPTPLSLLSPASSQKLIQIRRPIKSGYNSHYVRTLKTGSVTPKPKYTSYDELVILQEGQVLPAFILKFEKQEVERRFEEWQTTNVGTGMRRDTTESSSGGWVDLGTSNLAIRDAKKKKQERKISKGKKSEVDRFMERTKRKISAGRPRTPSGSKLIRAIRGSKNSEEDPIPLADVVEQKSGRKSRRVLDEEDEEGLDEVGGEGWRGGAMEMEKGLEEGEKEEESKEEGGRELSGYEKGEKAQEETEGERAKEELIYFSEDRDKVGEVNREGGSEETPCKETDGLL